MNSENATDLDALGLTSLVLSAITLLTLAGIIFLFYHFVTDFRDYDYEELLFTVSPLLSVLTTIVAFIARKRGSAKQKKAANVSMIVGILGS